MNGSSRREFVRLAGLAAGATGLAIASTGRAAGQPASDREPDAVLARLLEGNKRFVSGRLLHPGRKPEDFAALAEGQAPLAAIVIKANVEKGVERLKGLDPILSKLAKSGELKVIGGSYELRTGAVEVFG